MNLQGMFYN